MYGPWFLVYTIVYLIVQYLLETFLIVLSTHWLNNNSYTVQQYNKIYYLQQYNIIVTTRQVQEQVIIVLG